MIKSKRTILGQEVEDAVSKTMYFGTYFNGKCSINLGDFLSQESRDADIKNCIETTLNVECKEKLDEINKLVYEIAMITTGGVEC